MQNLFPLTNKNNFNSDKIENSTNYNERNIGTEIQNELKNCKASMLLIKQKSNNENYFSNSI